MRAAALTPGRLADAVVEHLRPLQQRYGELTAEPGFLDSVLAAGAQRASETAEQTLADVRDALGFMPRVAAPKAA